LGTASSYAVLGGQSVTNTGPSVINGDLGVSPGTSITGFPPGLVNGVQHSADAPALQAQTDLIAAYNDAAGQAVDASLAAELGGLTLVPGVYRISAAQLTGTLTLDAQGDPNAVWVFQVDSSLITASSSVVSLINGAAPCNVFWKVGSSATLGTNSTFVGTLMALTSISATTGADIEGRLLARNGSVTLDTNTITRSTCTPTTTTSSTVPDTTTTSSTVPDTTTTSSTVPETTIPGEETTTTSSTVPDTTTTSSTVPETTIPGEETTTTSSTVPESTTSSTVAETTIPGEATTTTSSTVPDTFPGEATTTTSSTVPDTFPGEATTTTSSTVPDTFPGEATTTTVAAGETTTVPGGGSGGTGVESGVAYGPGAGGTLPHTGTQAGATAAVGGFAIALGGLLLMVARRREVNHPVR
jgi:LPXTG-motif cell wall-anchored protein